jgi:hypothetical protein
VVRAIIGGMTADDIVNIDPKRIVEVRISGQKLGVVPGSFKVVNAVLETASEPNGVLLWDRAFIFQGELDAGEGAITGPLSSIEAFRLGNPRYLGE